MKIPNKRINFIGCGNLGRSLARLWHDAGLVEIGDILTGSAASAASAVHFIGAGTSLAEISKMRPAELYLIGCTDNRLAQCCDALVASGLLQPGVIVFHCSGSLSSEVLQTARAQGASVASMHPVKSFADPVLAISRFKDTYCGVEGDADALQCIIELVEGIGGVSFKLNAEHKTLYHAASVMACNYLISLEASSLQVFEQAGVPQDLAMKLLQPIVEGTVENFFNMGPAQALTGPIARGDHSVVERQTAALGEWDHDLAEIYRLLGKQALALSEQQGSADPADLKRINTILSEKQRKSLK